MSFEKIIQYFNSLEFDDNKKLTDEDIGQFLNGRIFDESLFNAIPTPIYFKDLESRYQNCNKAFIEYLGLTRNEVIGKKTSELHSKESSDFYCAKDNELIENREKQIYDAIVASKNKEKRLFRFYQDVLLDSSGEPRGIVSTMYDITDTHEKKFKLQRMNQLLHSLMEVSQAVLEINTMKDLFEVVIEKALEAIAGSDFGCVLVKDSEDNLTIISQRGYSKEESEGFKIKLQDSYSYTYSKDHLENPVIIDNIQKIVDDFPEIVPPEYETVIQSSLSTPIIIKGELIALINVDSCHRNAFDDYDIELMTIFKNQIELVIRNIRLYQQVVQISQTDPLTGLYNRGYFENCIDDIVKRALRYEESFCLVLIDLNNLKIVNDLLGHNVGDKYINNFAKIFNEYIRESDLLARFGGDEFIAVFFNSDFQQLNERIEKINRKFMKQKLIEHQNIIQSFSYGIAHFPRDSQKYNDLVRIADERMYHYKRILKSGMYCNLKD